MDENQYMCDRCNKIFNRKYHLARHLNKKTPCKALIESKRIHVNPNESNSYLDQTGLNEKNKDQIIYECNHCKKHFSTNSNMHKHMKRSCKKKEEVGNYIKLQKMFEQMKKEMEILQHTIKFGSNNEIAI